MNAFILFVFTVIAPTGTYNREMSRDWRAQAEFTSEANCNAARESLGEDFKARSRCVRK